MRNLRAGMAGLMLCLSLGCNQGDSVGENEPTADETENVQASVEPVNTRCPIMGGEIHEITDETPIIEWNGKKIAFCCPGCDEEFEKLSDEEKEAKLAKATGPAESEEG